VNLKKVYIIIPTHNRKARLKGCLLSLGGQSFRNFQIVVVDDGSSDGTSEVLSSDFKDVVTLRGDGNLWWTGATNLGLKYVLKVCEKTDFILTLNDDVVIGKDYLLNLVSFAGKRPRTLVGSVLLREGGDGSILDGGYKQNWLIAKGKALNRGKDLEYLPKDHYEETSVLSGRGTLIPAEVFFKLGLYDQKHLPHHGDLELSRRAYLNGYRLVVYYGAVIYTHEDSQPGNLGLKNLWWGFFNIKSSRNIKERFWFSILGAENVPRGVIFFTFDLFWVIGGIVARWFKIRPRYPAARDNDSTDKIFEKGHP